MEGGKERERVSSVCVDEVVWLCVCIVLKVCNESHGDVCNALSRCRREVCQSVCVCMCPTVCVGLSTQCFIENSQPLGANLVLSSC
jgi:hypothetical protein